MKRSRIFSLSAIVVVLMLLSGFSSPEKKMNPSYTISLSTPYPPIAGNTEYDVRVTYASGNVAYQLTMLTGFMILSKNPTDANSSGYTVFHIKTYPMVTHIAGRIDAEICNPSCHWGDSQNFGY